MKVRNRPNMVRNYKNNNGLEILVVVLFIHLAFSCLVSTASAGAPPPQYRTADLLPDSPDSRAYYSNNQAIEPDDAYNITTKTWDILMSLNRSTDERFLETDYMDIAESPHPETQVALFPVLSGYWRSQKYISFESGVILIALDWYSDNRSTFITAQNDLFRYLRQHGTIKNTTLNLSTALAETNNPFLAGLKDQQIPVTQYESSSTSGYFIFHDIPLFPGDLYRISYYGTTGSISYYGDEISDYGKPGTAGLEDSDTAIRRLMVKKIYDLVDEVAHSNAYWGTNVSQDSTMPFFPDLSPYRAYKKFIYLGDGRQYVSEVWYFDDTDTFPIKKKELIQYLKNHGTLSNEILDLSEEFAQTNNTYLLNYGLRQVNATRYVSNETSGFFIIHPDRHYPGNNYYIAFYGVIGPSDFQDSVHPLKIFITTVAPELKMGGTFDLDMPDQPSISSAIETPLLVMLAGLGFFASFLLKRRKR